MQHKMLRLLILVAVFIAVGVAWFYAPQISCGIGSSSSPANPPC